MKEVKAIVCLPTRNEEQSISSMIHSIRELGLELFVSDSDSTDSTTLIAAEHHVEVYPRKKPGKAWGIRDALQIAGDKGYDVLVYMDCDNTYPVDKIPQLVELSREFDMVIGVRNFKEISFVRRMVNYFHTGLINILFGAHFKDVNSGFRALKTKRFTGLLEAENMDLEVELCCKSIRLKIPFSEYSISYGERTGESTVNLKDFLEITARIFREFVRK